MRWRCLLAGVAVVAMPVTVPVPAAAASPKAAEWHACDDGFECASLAVPLDYRRLRWRTIRLALIRRPASGRRLGTLIVNPGGPGGSGVDFVRRARTLPRVLGDFDLVGFDPRGVGDSSPVACWAPGRYEGAFRAAKTRPTRGAFGAALRQGATFDRTCRDGLASYVGTGYVARDLDRIRRALGEQKLTYFGISYGTYIGAVYANLFPKRVGVMVLDGAYDPDAYANHPYLYDHRQYVGLDAALGRLFDWCVRTACPFGNGDPAGAFDRLLTRLDDENTSFPLMYQVMWRLNEGRPGWVELATDLAAADAGSGPLLEPLTAHDYAELTANTVVECADRRFPRSRAALARALEWHSRAAPRLGPAMAYGPPGYDHSHGTACVQWPHARISRYRGPFSQHTAGRVLVVGSTGDPDTPYVDAPVLAQRLHGHLLTFNGEGHAAFFQSACTKTAVRMFLTDPAVPPPAVCDDDPEPEPVGEP